MFLHVQVIYEKRNVLSNDTIAMRKNLDARSSTRYAAARLGGLV